VNERGPQDERDDDPNSPWHRDHDLSESSPEYYFEARPKPWFARRWFLWLIALLVVAGMFLPLFQTLR